MSDGFNYYVAKVYTYDLGKNERSTINTVRKLDPLLTKICVIIDGMDQAKTNLPNTKHIAKSTSALWRLRTHVTGVIAHTRAPHVKNAFVFVDTLQFPHDSNLTLTLLLKSLVSCSKQ